MPGDFFHFIDLCKLIILLGYIPYILNIQQKNIHKNFKNRKSFIIGHHMIQNLKLMHIYNGLIRIVQTLNITNCLPNSLNRIIFDPIEEQCLSFYSIFEILWPTNDMHQFYDMNMILLFSVHYHHALKNGLHSSF